MGDVRTLLAGIGNNNLYETPEDMLHDACRRFGVSPTLDVCATAETAKFARYFTPEDDALRQQWDEDFFMNCPYGPDYGCKGCGSRKITGAGPKTTRSCGDCGSTALARLHTGASDWVRYAYNQHLKHDVDALLLLYNKSDTRWYHNYVYDGRNNDWLGEVRPIRKRVKFMLGGHVPKRCRTCKKTFLQEDRKCPDCKGSMSAQSSVFPCVWIVYRGHTYTVPS